MIQSLRCLSFKTEDFTGRTQAHWRKSGLDCNWSKHFIWMSDFSMHMLIYMNTQPIIPFPIFPIPGRTDHILLPPTSMMVFLDPPRPTTTSSIPLWWSIYQAFIGPRTSPPLDNLQGNTLLHMLPVPLGWWLTTRELWGFWLVDIVFLLRLLTPLSSFSPFSNSSIGDPALSSKGVC